MSKDEKSLTKSDSMGRLLALNRLDNIFKDVFDPFFERFDSLWRDWDLSMNAFDQLQPKSSFPKVNVIEKEDSYDIEIAVAGFDKDDVELELKDNAMLIKADKKEKHESEDAKSGVKYLTKEIAARSFRRTVVFPSEINSDDVSAKYENGIIKCRVGKVEEDKPSSVKIEVE